ncbi:MAG: DNA-directed RNA polymerase subunit alpha [Flavobacteriaceae bacterium]|jgi:DNA-directed RNA polymerase subunit alpha
MQNTDILLPSKPKIVSEEGVSGVYEIENLYPGYGHTLGNSLRRIILSSLPGAAITALKIEGVDHEFVAKEGIKEDVIVMILNLRNVRFKLLTDEPQTVTLSVDTAKIVTAADIEISGQVEVLNKDQYICEVTKKGTKLNIEMTIEKGLGYVSKDAIAKERIDIGMIALDAVFTPIRRVSYEVENMRVGDKTNHNRLRIKIETDGSIEPRAALGRALEIMIDQLQAIFGYSGLDELTLKGQDEKHIRPSASTEGENTTLESGESEEDTDGMTEVMKTRVDSLNNLSTRTLNVLDSAGIRTVGGLAQKSKEDILNLEGMGDKGLQEIKRAVSEFGIVLKD